MLMFIHMLLYTYGKTFSPQVDEKQCKYEEKGDLLVGEKEEMNPSNGLKPKSL